MQIIMTIVLTVIIFYFFTGSLKDIFALIISLGVAFLLQKVVRIMLEEMKATKKG